jgi:hypothetical protein
MRKKLYFDKTFSIGIPMYILIDNGKIREFDGANFVTFFLKGMNPKFKLFKLNSDFSLERVSKYDKKKNGINANFKIICADLFSNILKETYIRLNPLEKFIIDYSKKETIFHNMNFTQKLLIAILITIPTAIVVTQFKSCNQVNIPSLKTSNHAINTAISKADTVSTHTSKLDRDSLSLN